MIIYTVFKQEGEIWIKKETKIRFASGVLAGAYVVTMGLCASTHIKKSHQRKELVKSIVSEHFDYKNETGAIEDFLNGRFSAFAPDKNDRVLFSDSQIITSANTLKKYYDSGDIISIDIPENPDFYYSKIEFEKGTEMPIDVPNDSNLIFTSEEEKKVDVIIKKGEACTLPGYVLTKEGNKYIGVLKARKKCFDFDSKSLNDYEISHDLCVYLDSSDNNSLSINEGYSLVKKS